jgi:hypothetical protein
MIFRRGKCIEKQEDPSSGTGPRREGICPQAQVVMDWCRGKPLNVKHHEGGTCCKPGTKRDNKLDTSVTGLEI